MISALLLINMEAPKPLSKRVVQEWYLVLPAIIAWLRGWFLRFKCFVGGTRLVAGSGLRIYGPCFVSGPGRVVLGKNVVIVGNAIKPVCIRTLARSAVISCGDHVALNGTAINSVQSVSIGRLSSIADAFITDTVAHSLDSNRRQLTVLDVESAPVVIEENVWISVNVTVLHGVRIGMNSVVGAFSLVRGDVPVNVFAAGSPLQVIGDIVCDE